MCPFRCSEGRWPRVVVVVYHITIVAIGHGLLKKFWPFLVLGCVLRTAGNSIILNYADPLTSLELLNYYLNIGLLISGLYINPELAFLARIDNICKLCFDFPNDLKLFC